jgi:dihydrofolate reductase
VADAVEGAQVDSERRLAISSLRHKVEPAARAEQDGAESGHHVPALVFVYASDQLGRTLIAHDLVEELRLFVFVAVAGAGERLFGRNMLASCGSWGCC